MKGMRVWTDMKKLYEEEKQSLCTLFPVLQVFITSFCWKQDTQVIGAVC